MRLWNVENGSLSGVLRGHHDAVKACEYTADGTALASGSNDMTVSQQSLVSLLLKALLPRHFGSETGRIEGWMDGWMDGRMDGWMERWKDGRMEGWKDGRMEGWKDGRISDPLELTLELLAGSSLGRGIDALPAHAAWPYWVRERRLSDSRWQNLGFVVTRLLRPGVGC